MYLSLCYLFFPLLYTYLLMLLNLPIIRLIRYLLYYWIDEENKSMMFYHSLPHSTLNCYHQLMRNCNWVRVIP